jgi:hypothetical protein
MNYFLGTFANSLLLFTRLDTKRVLDRVEERESVLGDTQIKQNKTGRQ